MNYLREQTLEMKIVSYVQHIYLCIYYMRTTKKLANINQNTNGKIMSVDYSEFYRQNSPLLYLSMNIKRNILLVYIPRELH